MSRRQRQHRGAPRTSELHITPKKLNKNKARRVDGLGSGDTELLLDFIEPSVLLESNAADNVFSALLEEVQFGEMKHYGIPVPRLASIQGSIAHDGGLADAAVIPLYRHPADEQPEVVAWTPLVRRIADEAEAKFGHTFNHALVQLYRTSQDSISRHADKTLDIARGTPIISVSFGASRLFTLRSKATLKAGTGAETTHKITLMDNSALHLGLDTNAKFTHQILSDRRADGQRREDETAYDGQRISITLRNVATYVRRKDGRVFGQGARHKTEAALDSAIAAEGKEARRAGEVVGTKVVGEVSRAETGETKVEDTEEAEAEVKGEAKGETKVEALKVDVGCTGGSGGVVDDLEAMHSAFRQENKEADFDWDGVYGGGFDAIGFTTLQAVVPVLGGGAAALEEDNAVGAAAAAVTVELAAAATAAATAARVDAAEPTAD